VTIADAEAAREAAATGAGTELEIPVGGKIDTATALRCQFAAASSASRTVPTAREEPG
jgi:hypothetical protein